MKTYIATLSQKQLWTGNLPPISEGMRIVVDGDGWIVDRAFIHLGASVKQTVYVVDSREYEQRQRNRLG